MAKVIVCTMTDKLHPYLINEIALLNKWEMDFMKQTASLNISDYKNVSLSLINHTFYIKD